MSTGLEGPFQSRQAGVAVRILSGHMQTEKKGYEHPEPIPGVYKAQRQVVRVCMRAGKWCKVGRT